MTSQQLFYFEVKVSFDNERVRRLPSWSPKDFRVLFFVFILPFYTFFFQTLIWSMATVFGADKGGLNMSLTDTRSAAINIRLAVNWGSFEQFRYLEKKKKTWESLVLLRTIIFWNWKNKNKTLITKRLPIYMCIGRP